MKLVCGIGINDADYQISIKEELPKVSGKRKQKVIWICPYYTKWSHMLKRCYDSSYKQLHPTYVGVTCCEEWHTFSNFKSWMVEQEWENMELDKDIINPKSKTYSPENCAFISVQLNKFCGHHSDNLRTLPIGVSLHKSRGTFVARCNDPFQKKRVQGLYRKCPNEAHKDWLTMKHKHALMLADIQTDKRVADALRLKYIGDFYE